MGKDKGKQKCGTCRGQGGWWETGNGKKDKPPRQWIKCRTCNGTGVA